MWNRLLPLAPAGNGSSRPAIARQGTLLEAVLTVDYAGRPQALREVALSVREGEILGLAGESGSGKSTVALALMNLAARRGAKVRGRVLWNGADLLGTPERDLRRLRGRELALMLQNPMAALNPRLRLATQFREAWRAHAPGAGAWRERTVDTLARLGLPADEPFLRRYPGELSIGMAQRVLLALTILHRPKLLIADEPTSALDVITQSEVLALFRRLRSDFGMALLIISHDLVALASVCDRIAVLRTGELVETLPAARLFTGAKQEYTRRLIAALPRLPASCEAPVAAENPITVTSVATHSEPAWPAKVAVHSAPHPPVLQADSTSV
jgi:ABC-type glutathione transport system ATPase component